MFHNVWERCRDCNQLIKCFRSWTIKINMLHWDKNTSSGTTANVPMSLIFWTVSSVQCCARNWRSCVWVQPTWWPAAGAGRWEAWGASDAAGNHSRAWSQLQGRGHKQRVRSREISVIRERDTCTYGFSRQACFGHWFCVFESDQFLEYADIIESYAVNGLSVYL